MKGEENSAMLFRPVILFHRGSMEETLKARNSPHSLLSKKGKRKPSPIKVQETIILNKSFLFCLWAMVTFPSLCSSVKHRGRPSWKRATGEPAWSPNLFWGCHALCQWTRAGCHRGDSGAEPAEISHWLSLPDRSFQVTCLLWTRSLISVSWCLPTHQVNLSPCRLQISLSTEREEEAKGCSKKFRGGSHTITRSVANHRGLYPCRWC